MSHEPATRPPAFIDDVRFRGKPIKGNQIALSGAYSVSPLASPESIWRPIIAIARS